MKTILSFILSALFLTACGLDGMLDIPSLSKEFNLALAGTNAGPKNPSFAKHDFSGKELSFAKGELFAGLDSIGKGVFPDASSTENSEKNDQTECTGFSIPLDNSESTDDLSLYSGFATIGATFDSFAYLFAGEKTWRCQHMIETLEKDASLKIEIPLDEAKLAKSYVGERIDVSAEHIIFKVSQENTFVQVKTKLTCAEPFTLECSALSHDETNQQCSSFFTNYHSQACSFDVQDLPVILNHKKVKLHLKGSIKFGPDKLSLDHISW